MTLSAPQPASPKPDTPALARGDVIRIKKSWALIAIAALALVAAGGVALGLALPSGLAGNQAAVASQPPSLGPASARVVVMEFSDFYCEYCKQFHDETFSALMDKYGNQIRFVYYDFPTSGGQQAAEAASCAKEQGAYWDYHNALFANFMGYSSVDQFASLAGTFSLNQQQFLDCVNSGKYRAAVQQSYQLGVSYGVRATPTFVINGTLLIGAQPFSTFERVIDQKLSQ